MRGVAHDVGEVDIGGLFPTERLVEQIVLGRGGKVLVAAYHMGDGHGVVVHHVGEVVGGHFVGLDEDLIIEVGAVYGDVAVDEVVNEASPCVGTS